MSIISIKDSRANSIKHLTILFSIALFSLLLILTDGYFDEWGKINNSIQKFLNVRSRLEEYLSYFYLIVPAIFICWSTLINGKNKIVRRILKHSMFFILYIVSTPIFMLIISFSVESLLEILNINSIQSIRTTISNAAFLIVTTCLFRRYPATYSDDTLPVNFRFQLQIYSFF